MAITLHSATRHPIHFGFSSIGGVFGDGGSNGATSHVPADTREGG